MLRIAAEQKIKLKDKLIKLQMNFDEIDFFQAVVLAKSMVQIVLFEQVEKWLLGFLAEEKLMAVNGLLAVLYFELGLDFVKARDYALKADMYFPDTEIWEDIIKGSIVNGALEKGDQINYE